MTMTELWLGWCSAGARQDLMRALRSIAPFAALSFATSATDLRERLMWEEPGTVGVIVGLSESGISDENAAAALAFDGRAAEVVLVCREATGSLRSRMARAGVTRIIEVPAAARRAVPAATCGADEARASCGSSDGGSLQWLQAPSGADAGVADAWEAGGRSGGRAPANPAAQSASRQEAADLAREAACGGMREGGFEPSDPGWPWPEEPMAPDDAWQQWMDPAEPGPWQGLDEAPATGSGRNHEDDGQIAMAPSGRERPDSASHGQDASERASYGQDGGRPAISPSPILTFVSGRGGVGKTALASVASCIGAAWGMNVALVDLDLSCGNLYSCFGLPHGSDLGRLSAEASAEELGRACVLAADKVSLWGPCERPEMAERVMPLTSALLRYLASRYDLVLADTSTTFTDAVAQAAQLSDRVVVVNDERTGALASAARTSSLVARLGVARTRIVRISNLANPRAKGEGRIDRGQDVLDDARVFNVFDGDVEAEELMAAGHVESLARSSSDLAVSLSSFLACTLKDLGRLPDSEEARKAVLAEGRKRKAGFFSRRKKAS